MAQLCASCSMRITDYSVEQCAQNTEVKTSNIWHMLSLHRKSKHTTRWIKMDTSLPSQLHDFSQYSSCCCSALILGYSSWHSCSLPSPGTGDEANHLQGMWLSFSSPHPAATLFPGSPSHPAASFLHICPGLLPCVVELPSTWGGTRAPTLFLHRKQKQKFQTLPLNSGNIRRTRGHKLNQEGLFKVDKNYNLISLTSITLP